MTTSAPAARAARTSVGVTAPNIKAALAARQGSARLASIQGATMNLAPAVRHASAVAASGTAVARARVDWVRVDDVLVCLDCQREFTGGRLSVCPSCGADALVVGPAAEVTVLEWEAGRPAAEDEAST